MFLASVTRHAVPLRTRRNSGGDRTMYTANSEPFDTEFEASYAWDYATREEALRNLYEKSKLAQWNAKSDVDWAIEVDPEAENIPDPVVPFYGTEYWNRFTPEEVRRFRH